MTRATWNPKALGEQLRHADCRGGMFELHRVGNSIHAHCHDCRALALIVPDVDFATSVDAPTVAEAFMRTSIAAASRPARRQPRGSVMRRGSQERTALLDEIRQLASKKNGAGLKLARVQRRFHVSKAKALALAREAGLVMRGKSRGSRWYSPDDAAPEHGAGEQTGR